MEITEEEKKEAIGRLNWGRNTLYDPSYKLTEEDQDLLDRTDYPSEEEIEKEVKEMRWWAKRRK